MSRGPSLCPMCRPRRPLLWRSSNALRSYTSFFSGAVIRASSLYIATIGTDAADRRRLIGSLCGEIELKGRSQDDVDEFDNALGRFVADRAIECLMLALSPSKGGHMATADAYKIEAIVQLSVSEVKTVSAISLTAFARHQPSVPGPDHRRLARAQAQHQERAILAAAFAAHSAAKGKRS